jgi:hypothetical protein
MEYKIYLLSNIYFITNYQITNMLSRVLQRQARNQIVAAQRIRYFSSDVAATEDAPKQ